MLIDAWIRRVVRRWTLDLKEQSHLARVIQEEFNKACKCDVCDGTGMVDEQDCYPCDGTGKTLPDSGAD